VLRDELVAAQTEASDIQRELTKAEADVEQVRQRAARDQARLEAGQGGHKELESLQHELATLGRRQSELEDAELEVMERLETVTSTVQRLEAERDTLQGDVDAVAARRDAALADLSAERDKLVRDRVGMVAGLDAALIALYEKVRESTGTGAAMLRARRCEGCRLELNPQELQRIRAAEPDEVVRCEECRRILVRTGESGL
jgi:predicted  nucleic acid-binding Zn-ribbon protein